MYRQIMSYPHRALRVPAAPVDVVDDEVRRLLDDLTETCLAERGAGLSASQIGVPLRVCVLIDEAEGRVIEAVNPVADPTEAAKRVVYQETCLSLPGSRAGTWVAMDVDRWSAVLLRGLDRHGEPIGGHHGMTLGTPLCAAMQHELQHMDGTLLVDGATRMKRRLIEADAARRVRPSGGVRGRGGPSPRPR